MCINICSMVYSVILTIESHETLGVRPWKYFLEQRETILWQPSTKKKSKRELIWVVRNYCTKLCIIYHSWSYIESSGGEFHWQAAIYQGTIRNIIVFLLMMMMLWRILWYGNCWIRRWISSTKVVYAIIR